MVKTRKVRTTIPATQPDSQRLSQLKLIAGASNDEDIPLMSTHLEPIRYVPTIFTSFNRAIVLGGAPLRGTYLVHGPSSSGKSAFAVGLLNSFVQRGHFAGFIDAEHAASKKWFIELGADPDAILFKQPDTFEEAMATIDKWIRNFRKGKEDGVIPKNKGFALVIDTIHKLVPKNEMTKLLAAGDKLTDAQAIKKANDNIAKGWGRYRANLIAVWINKMTPVVGKNNIALINLAHERKNPNADDWNEPEYTVKGGEALIFESMARIRVTPGPSIKIPTTGAKKIIIGHTSHFQVVKNKVGYPNEHGEFHILHGKDDCLAGFDLPREAFIEGVKREVIVKAGAWYYLPDNTKHQGDENAITYLHENPDAYNQLYDALAIKSEYECV